MMRQMTALPVALSYHLAGIYAQNNELAGDAAFPLDAFAYALLILSMIYAGVIALLRLPAMAPWHAEYQ